MSVVTYKLMGIKLLYRIKNTRSCVVSWLCVWSPLKMNNLGTDPLELLEVN